MATSERKKRELKQRGALIVDTARILMLEVGYLELNMDRIAEVTEYSKGTIYQHFSCKEEILVAILLESGRKIGELLERGATFRGKPRERMAAMSIGYELFVRLNPEHFKAELLVQNDSIRGKVSDALCREFEGVDQRNVQVVSGVVRDAIAEGDLALRPGVIPEEITFGLWTGAFGAYVLMALETNLTLLGISDPRQVVWDNMHALLDGFGWHPFTSELDYEQTKAQVLRDVYPDESKKAGLI